MAVELARTERCRLHATLAEEGDETARVELLIEAAASCVPGVNRRRCTGSEIGLDGVQQIRGIVGPTHDDASGFWVEPVVVALAADDEVARQIGAIGRAVDPPCGERATRGLNAARELAGDEVAPAHFVGERAHVDTAHDAEVCEIIRERADGGAERDVRAGRLHEAGAAGGCKHVRECRILLRQLRIGRLDRSRRLTIARVEAQERVPNRLRSRRTRGEGISPLRRPWPAPVDEGHSTECRRFRSRERPAMRDDEVGGA